MGLFSQAAFYTTVNHIKDLPQHGGREVAFVGRSNAGKSSAINTLANRSKDFSYYVIDVSVAYDEDTDRVAEVLRRTGAELQVDPRFGAFILEPLEVLGVDAFGDSAVVLKVRIRTMPLKQWEVGRELRRRVKKAFAAAGIEIPYPQRVVTTRVERA